MKTGKVVRTYGEKPLVFKFGTEGEEYMIGSEVRKKIINSFKSTHVSYL